jgi:hypothetical protein
MEDIIFEKQLKRGYFISIRIEDHGERLTDYEPFWKWHVSISKSNQKLVDETGPKDGFYDTRDEAVEACMNLVEKHIECEMCVRQIKREVVYGFKMTLNEIEDELRHITDKWNKAYAGADTESGWIEEICELLELPQECTLLGGDRNKLSFIWKKLNDSRGETPLTEEKLNQIKEKLKN